MTSQWRGWRGGRYYRRLTFMLLLVTGASGMGKSTVRNLVAARFASRIDSAELAEVAGPPEWSLRWRHQAVEKAVQRALQAQRQGRHFLLCGDPVPPAELYAVPSAEHLERVAVCLLDATEEAQRGRLLARGDDPSLLLHHTAFAAWMRAHLVNPRQRLDVVRQGGWEEMNWERALVAMERQEIHLSERIDTSVLTPDEVAELVALWICRQISPELSSISL